MTSELTSKKLALFKEMLPDLSRVAFLHSRKEPGPVLALTQAEGSASALGMSVIAIPVDDLSGMTHAFEEIAGGHFDGLFVYPDWIIVFRQFMAFVTGRTLADWCLTAPTFPL
jgi:ABC-type uncharacterized transport system substrate-binding protein